MKTFFIGLACITSFGINAQIVTPKLSPAAEVHQTVGLTNIVIEYSRPAKRGRTVFPDVVSMDEVWRTGANKNSTITVSDNLIFGKDTLKTGTYAIYTKPSSANWDIIFYSNHDNWGTPDTWNEGDVALSVKAKVTALHDEIESFTIAIDNVTTKDAVLSFAWDKTKAAVKFTVATDETVLSSIERTMNGPSAGDYYNAADYYLAEKIELKKGDCIYLTTDGYPDQFGGEKGKKFKYGPFKKLIIILPISFIALAYLIKLINLKKISLRIIVVSSIISLLSYFYSLRINYSPLYWSSKDIGYYYNINDVYKYLILILFFFIIKIFIDIVIRLDNHRMRQPFMSLTIFIKINFIKFFNFNV